MASHPLKRNNVPRTSNANTRQTSSTTTSIPTPPSISAYDSTAHSDGGTYDQIIGGDNGLGAGGGGGMSGDEDFSNEYSEDNISGASQYDDDDGDDEYDDLNSEAEEYYNSGASELVTTVR